MGIDYTGFAHPKGTLRIEKQREKRLTESDAEREARRIVRLRDGGKCQVPGCKEASEHLHHVVYRSKSKRLKWAPANLVSLCRAHHDLIHAGRITVSVEKDGEFIFHGRKKDLSFRL